MSRFVVLAVVALAAVGCSDATDLPQTVEIEGSGYTIDYPDGWSTETSEGFLGVGEFEVDIPPGADLVLQGPLITVEHSAPTDLGLDDGATIEDFVDLTAQVFSWPEDSTIEDATVAGSPARTVRFEAPERLRRDVVFAMGSLGDRFALFTLQVNSDQDIDASIPVFEDMLASLREVE